MMPNPMQEGKCQVEQVNEETARCPNEGSPGQRPRILVARASKWMELDLSMTGNVLVAGFQRVKSQKLEQILPVLHGF